MPSICVIHWYMVYGVCLVYMLYVGTESMLYTLYTYYTLVRGLWCMPNIHVIHWYVVYVVCLVYMLYIVKWYMLYTLYTCYTLVRGVCCLYCIINVIQGGSKNLTS